MMERNGMDWIKKEIEIPNSVQKKADETLNRIRGQAANGQESGKKKIYRLQGGRRKSVIAAILAAALIVGTATVGIAAYIASMSAGLKDSLNVSDEQEQQLMAEGDLVQDLQGSDSARGDGTEEEDGLNATSVTDQGVTITANQTIMDNNGIWIAFAIEGFTYDTDTSPFIRDIDFSIENAQVSSMNGSYYTEEGLEYIMVLGVEDNDASLVGKRITVTFSGLGEAVEDKEKGWDEEVTVDGTWELSWILSGTGQSREVELNAELGDTGAVVQDVEISPTSIKIHYIFPRAESEIQTAGGNTAHTLEELPAFSGVVLKDGTVYIRIVNGGSEGYEPDGMTYVSTKRFSGVFDPEAIDSLLFIRPDLNLVGEEPLTLEDMFVVPLED